MRLLKWLFIVLAVLLLGVSVWFHLATGSLPVSFTRSYTVYLKDKDTGQPISGVIAEGRWFARRLSLETTSKTYARAYVMSGKNGKIHIPWKIGIHPYSYYEGFSVGFHHPFYDAAGVGYFSGMPAKGDANGYDKNTEWWKKPIEMRTLEKKYADAKCVAAYDQYRLLRLDCNEQGKSINSITSIVSDYFSLIDSRRIRHYRKELHPSRREAADQISRIATPVFSESPEKPKWLMNLGAFDK
jgi:hypothetical protein